MNDTFPRYPAIPLVYKCPEIFAVKEVVATEKLNGSTFRLFFPGGMSSISDVRYGSHEVEYASGEFFPLGRAREMFLSNPQRLIQMWEVLRSYDLPDVTVFGEAYGPGIKCKGVKYSTGQEQLFRSFGLMTGSNFVTYDLFCEILDKMEVPRVHEVWRGAPTQEAFDALLEKPSTEGRLNGIDDPTNVAEGVVIQSTPLFRTVFGEWLIVKHKARKFAEVAPPKEPKGPKGPGPADEFAATFVMVGRVINAIGRLHDRGTPLKAEMSDMPTLLDEIMADLHKECNPELTALGLPDKQVRGAVSKVLGPIYREMLARGA